MKTEEDEAFDELAKKQGDWGGGFKAKQAMAADKFIAAEERKVGERYGYVPKLHPNEWMDKPMATDKQHWSEEAWRRNNWRCSHGWLRGEQCETCNAAQEPPSEWEGIKAILDEYGLQAIDFVADFKAALAQPAQEPVREALKLAEIIEHFDSNDESLPLELLKEIAATLRALAQPAQEPHGYDWSMLEAAQESLREHMARIKELEAQSAQEPYDQTALELCGECGWKTLIPDECCLNCERKAQPAQEPTLQEQLDNSQALYVKAHEDWAKAVAALTELNTETNFFTVNTYLDKANTYVKKTCAYKEMVYSEIQRIKAKLKEKNFD